MTSFDHFQEKLEEIEGRYNELSEKLSQPDIVAVQNNFKQTAKNHHALEQTVNLYHSWQSAQKENAGTQEVLRGESDKDMRALAQDELTGLQKRSEDLMQQLKVMLLP